MTKRKKTTPPPSQTAPLPPVMHPALYVLGLLSIAVAGGAAFMLCLAHLTGMTLLGCGPDSGCGALTSSAWGRVPLVNWPVSFVGFAWFAALGVAWLASARGISPMLRWAIRLGAVMSLMFIGVMIAKNTLCNWCLTTHIANLVLLGVTEVAARRTVTAGRPLIFAAATFVVASLGLVIAQLAVAQEVEERQVRQLEEDLGKLVEKTPCEELWGENGFTGRYLRGPADAPIRIMMYSDFQCPDCKTFEDHLRPYLARRRQDFSVSMKHFPFCGHTGPGAKETCNEYLGDKCPHENSCWAARAAETAGKLDGNGGFWRMHDWLFERDGRFTQDDFKAQLPQLGFDYNQFAFEMQQQWTLDQVKEDITEAKQLGLFYTPLVFINGVQLRNPQVKGNLDAAVNALDAAGLVRGSARDDCPPLALEKYINDWEEMNWRMIRFELRPFVLGVGSDQVQIAVVGDYQEHNTRALNDAVRKAIEGQSDVHYSFVHYPLDRACNPSLPANYPNHEHACRATRAAEAAGLLGGNDAFWAMHDWLLRNPKEVASDASLSAAASGIGLNGAALLEQMNAAEVTERLQTDIKLARPLIVANRFPTVYVNGRHVPRWHLPGQPVLETIIERARELGQPINRINNPRAPS